MLACLSRTFSQQFKWRWGAAPREDPKVSSSETPLERFPAYFDARQKLSKDRILDYDLPQEVKVMGNLVYINATLPGRFEINGNWVAGPVCLFPNLVLSWNIKSSADVVPHHFDIVRFIKPLHNYIIIGTGRTGKRLLSDSYQQLYASLGIHIEYAPTVVYRQFEACGSFNMAIEDSQKVVGFILPEDAD